jgi:ubiquinone/menaquinone biosynthesis C-methylase UbiE
MSMQTNEAIQVRYAAEASTTCCLSCGGALDHADVRPGETLVDLGSGRGLDVLKSARLVGPAGRATGIDMTPAMIEVARSSAARLKIKNAQFLEAQIDSLPLPDSSVDVVISNCTINHASDKAKVYAEIYRILKPGGRFIVSDIIADSELPDHIRNDPEAIAACYGGAITEQQYIDAIAAGGFRNLEILEKSEPYPKGKDQVMVRSITLRGIR